MSLENYSDVVSYIVSAGEKKGILGGVCDKGKPAFTPKDWQKDRNIDIDETTWLQMWKSTT